jgi:hypothetical protein
LFFQIYDPKEVSLLKKLPTGTKYGVPHFAPPSVAWRSVFYVGKDNCIHQLYFFQSFKHWVMTLHCKNLSKEFPGAEAKRIGPIAFRKDKLYHVFYVGQDNRLHLLRSFDQTQVWYHQVIHSTYHDLPVFVHPDSGPLSKEQNTCVSFKTLTKNGGWQIHHLLAFTDSTCSCQPGIPHHKAQLEPLKEMSS